MAQHPHGNPSRDTRMQAVGGLIGALLAYLALATGVAQAATTGRTSAAFGLRTQNGTRMAEAVEQTRPSSYPRLTPDSPARTEAPRSQVSETRPSRQA